MKHISAVVIAGIICIVLAAFAGYKFGKSTNHQEVKAAITGEHAIADDKCNRRRSGSMYFPGALYDDDAMRAISIFISDSAIKYMVYGNWKIEPMQGPFTWQVQPVDIASFREKAKLRHKAIDTAIFGYSN